MVKLHRKIELDPTPIQGLGYNIMKIFQIIAAHIMQVVMVLKLQITNFEKNQIRAELLINATLKALVKMKNKVKFRTMKLFKMILQKFFHGAQIVMVNSDLDNKCLKAKLFTKLLGFVLIIFQYSKFHAEKIMPHF